MSILEFYPITDTRCEKNLTLVNDMVEGGSLLAGLRTSAGPISVPESNVVSRSTLFDDLCASGEVIDHLVGYHENFAYITSLMHQFESSEILKKTTPIYAQYREGQPKYDKYIIDKVEKLVDTDSISAAIGRASEGEESDESMCKDLVVNETITYINYLVISCYTNGLVENPFYARMFALFQAGGLPCGWLGVEPKPENMTEQSCVECMQVFYLG